MIRVTAERRIPGIYRLVGVRYFIQPLGAAMIEHLSKTTRPDPQNRNPGSPFYPAARPKRPFAVCLLDATLSEVSLNPARSLRLQIVLGAVAVAWVVFVASLVLRPSAPSPEAVATLPPLGTALPLGRGRFRTAGIPPIAIGVPHEPEPVAVNPDVSHEAAIEPAPPSTGSRARDKAPLPPLPNASPVENAPLPPIRPAARPPIARPPAGYDGLTAVYDISTHSVYLPDGTALEAHSGLGDRLDNPRFVSERDRGSTPPGVYELTLERSRCFTACRRCA